LSEKLIIKKGWWWKLYLPGLGSSSGRWWQSTHCSNEDNLEVCIWELVSYLQNSESGKMVHFYHPIFQAKHDRILQDIFV